MPEDKIVCLLLKNETYLLDHKDEYLQEVRKTKKIWGVF